MGSGRHNQKTSVGHDPRRIAHVEQSSSPRETVPIKLQKPSLPMIPGKVRRAGGQAFPGVRVQHGDPTGDAERA